MLTWTDERCDELRQMCASPERPSAGDMGRELGVSRNAIIGKVLRLGLELPNHGNVSPTGGRRIPGRPRKLRFQHKPPTAPQPPVEPAILPEPTGLEITFMQLQPHHCRYPSGEGRDILFCGATAIEDAPYCQFHSRVCYQPAKGARG